MNIFKEIGGRIWAVWAIIVFLSSMMVVVFIPTIVCFFIPDPKGTRIFLWFARQWMNVFLNLIGCPLTIKGIENCKADENYVVICNHNSLMDVPLSSPYVPGGNKTIAKHTFIYIPVFNVIYFKGSVLVKRNNDQSRRESFDKMKAVLAKGLHMVIYPEGTRNRTDQPLKKFYDGAFKLAVAAKKDILPIVLFNTKKALPVEKTFFCWPHKLEMHFLPVIKTDDKTDKQLKEESFEIMSAYYAQHEKSVL
jgi:1-acyl-sn-glycerol-3-phosphate acyltransferase